MSDKLEINLTLLTLNDIDNLDGLNDFGGESNIEKIIRDEKRNTSHSIITINGDFLGPSHTSSLSKGKEVIDFFNHIGIDCVVIGNHEFDYGIETLKSRIADSNFYWFGANIVDSFGELLPGVIDSLILKFNKIKIGIFGVCTTDTANISNLKLDVNFLPIHSISKKIVEGFKKQNVDLIIALTHQTLEDDLNLAKEISEIDVILGGHDHFPISTIRYGTFIHKSGSDSKFLGRIDLNIQKHKNTTQVIPSWKMIPIKNKSVKKQKENLMPIINSENNWLESEILLCNELDTRADMVKTRENSLGNFVADFAKASLQADLSLINAGFIRGDTIYQAGVKIKLNDFIKMIPFTDKLVLVEVTGKQIKDILEWTLGDTPEPSKMFPHVSGIRITYDSSLPKNQKIKEIWLEDKPLDFKNKYKLATLDFLHSGGDSIIPLVNATLLKSESLEEPIGIHLGKVIKSQGILDIKLEKRVSDSKMS